MTGSSAIPAAGPFDARMKLTACALVLLAVLSAGCEKAGESKTEIRSKQKFESLDIGARRAEVRRVFGRPAGIVSEAGKTQVLYSRLKSREIFSVRIDDRKSWPVELKVFTKCKLRAPADYFVNGTVRALFVFGANESTVCKEIHVT